MLRLTLGRISLAIILTGLISVSAFAQEKIEKRVWEDNTGKFKIEAEFVEVREVPNGAGELEAKVFLRRIDNNKLIEVPLKRLCEADIAHVESLVNPAKEAEPKEMTPTESAGVQPPTTPPTTPPPTTPAKREPPVETTPPRNTEPPVRNTEPPVNNTAPGNSVPSTTPSTGSAPPANSTPDLNSQPGSTTKPPATTTTPRNTIPQFTPRNGNRATNEQMSDDGTGTDLPSTTPSETPPATTSPQPPSNSGGGAGDLPSSVLPFKRGGSGDSSQNSEEPPIASEARTDAIGSVNSSMTPPAGTSEMQPPSDSTGVETPSVETPSFESPTFDPPVGDTANANPSGNAPSTATAAPRRPVKIALPPIDPASVSMKVETSPLASQQLNDQQLVDSLELTGELRWRGRVGIRHDLVAVSPNVELVIGMNGSQFLDAVSSVGFVRIDSMTDNNQATYAPSVYAPRMPNPVTGWIAPRRSALKIQDGPSPVYVDVEFPRPEELPDALSDVRGEFKVAMVEQSNVITIDSVVQNNGVLNHESLVDKGLQVVVSIPDPMTIVARVAGDTNAVMDMRIPGVASSDVGVNQMSVGDEVYFQFNFIRRLPEGVALDIRLVDKVRTLTVPFSFASIPFEKER